MRSSTATSAAGSSFGSEAGTVFFWFLGGSVVLVWLVFQTPTIDFRMVALGAVLPLADAAFGGPRLLHTLLASVAMLTVVMVATTGKRLLRRRWLGLPIGMFLHLVLDGTWSDQQLFWWPLLRVDFTVDGLVEWNRGGLGIVLELAGLAALWWMVTRFDLTDPERRRRFLRSGQLDRSLLASDHAPPSC